jgi:poly(hydroxyalkanoate) depolymerase family esterase
MKSPMHPDMVEATRLTREGRLIEATALLQRMLQSGMEPDARADGTAAGSPPTGAAPIIELTPEVIEVSAPRPAPTEWAEANSDGSQPGDESAMAMPAWVRGLVDKVGRSGLMRSRARPALLRVPATAPDVVLKVGRFVTGTFTGAAGTRAYKLYVPSAYQGQPLPLVVMLHGCTQSADDFAAGTRMNIVGEERGCFVAYPWQPKSANGSKCWNWFKPGDQQRDRGEPSLIAGITRQIFRDYAIDRQRVYVAGLSAGGAAAAIMGATYPDIYAAIGVHSGLPCGAASDLPSAFSAMRQGGSASRNRAPRSSAFDGDGRIVPTIVFHGDKDATVHPQNGHHVIEQSRASSLGELRSVSHRGHAGGRTYSRTSHFDASGQAVFEMWVVHGAGHAWSGGSPAGSYADPQGPDASREMVRFFLEHSHPATRQI